MSLKVASATPSGYAVKTSGVVNHNAAYTALMWARIDTDLNTYGHGWSALGTATDTYTNSDWIGLDVDGTTITIGSYSGGAGAGANGTNLTVGAWNHLALRRNSATSLQALLNGVVDTGTVTTDVGSRAATQREQLGLMNADYPWFGQFAAIKIYQAALTDDEIKQEMLSLVPIRRANLVAWHPCIGTTLADLFKDFSGNGADWADDGTGDSAYSDLMPPVGYRRGRSRILVPVATGSPPQLLAPIADISAGAWTPSSGIDLYAMLDETTADAADYIVSTSASTCEVRLAVGSDPAVSTGHILRYQLLAGSGSVTVRLKQGAATIATFGPHTLTGSTQDFEQTLSGAQADSITDYSDLRVSFEAA